MIGAGSLSLPTALQDIGFYTALVFYIIITLISGTFAYMLSKTYSTFRAPLKMSLNLSHIRDPYPQVAKYVSGNRIRIVVIISILLSDFLGTAALILLPADTLVRSFEICIFKNLSTTENIRIWMIIFTTIVIPLTWNDRPKDNKAVAILSLMSALIGNILILILYYLSSEVMKTYSPSNQPRDMQKYILGIGIILATTDGFDVLPNIQEDMRDSRQYLSVIIRAYIMFVLITLPVMVGGYLLFHQHHLLSENILIELVRNGEALEHGNLHTIYKVISFVTLILFIIHLISTTVLQLNPTFQYMETQFPCRNGKYDSDFFF